MSLGFPINFDDLNKFDRTLKGDLLFWKDMQGISLFVSFEFAQTGCHLRRTWDLSSKVHRILFSLSVLVILFRCTEFFRHPVYDRIVFICSQIINSVIQLRTKRHVYLYLLIVSKTSSFRFITKSQWLHIYRYHYQYIFSRYFQCF